MKPPGPGLDGVLRPITRALLRREKANPSQMSNPGAKMLWVEQLKGVNSRVRWLSTTSPHRRPNGRRPLEKAGIRAEELRLYGVTVRKRSRSPQTDLHHSVADAPAKPPVNTACQYSAAADMRVGGLNFGQNPRNALRLRCLSHTSKHRVTTWREAGGDEFEPKVLKTPIIMQPLPSPCIALL